MGRDRDPKRVYADEFKRKAVKMVMPPNNRRVDEAAIILNMPYATLHGWRRQALAELDRGAELGKLERVKSVERTLEVKAKERREKEEAERNAVNLTVAGYVWVKPVLIINAVVTVGLIIERLVQIWI